jgi:excisionase family DNA binding protein
MTVPEAGCLLGISRNTAYAAAARGELPVVRIGRRVLVSKPRLLAMLGAAPEGDRVRAAVEPARREAWPGEVGGSTAVDSESLAASRGTSDPHGCAATRGPTCQTPDA